MGGSGSGIRGPGLIGLVCAKALLRFRFFLKICGAES